MQLCILCHKYLSIQTLRAVWYHLHNLKNVENTNGGLKLLVKSQAEACYFTGSITPSWVFSMFLYCTSGTKSRKASCRIFFNVPYWNKMFFDIKNIPLPMFVYVQAMQTGCPNYNYWMSASEKRKFVKWK